MNSIHRGIILIMQHLKKLDPEFAMGVTHKPHNKVKVFCIVTREEAQQGLQNTIDYVEANCAISETYLQTLHAVLGMLLVPPTSSREHASVNDDLTILDRRNGCEDNVVDDVDSYADPGDDMDEDRLLMTFVKVEGSYVSCVGEQHENSGSTVCDPHSEFIQKQKKSSEKDDSSPNSGLCSSGIKSLYTEGVESTSDMGGHLICFRCSKCYIYRSSYERHIRECVIPNNVSEDADTREANDESILHDCSSKNNDDSNSTLHCNTCNKTYSNRKQYSRHLKRRRHVRNANDAMPLQAVTCERCSKSFCNRRYYNRHKNRNKCKMHPFRCLLCSKVFLNLKDIGIHLVKHGANTACYCSVCKKDFSCLTELSAHVKSESVHCNTFMCDVCGQEFLHIKNLINHSTIHTGEKPYKCETCGKCFRQKHNLFTHQRIHTDERPFVCTVCGNGFRESSKLKVHMRSHTGERPYSCQVCGKTYVRPAPLRIHERIHTGERPYVCDICGKSFADPATLKLHKKLHTGEKPYQCKICGVHFRRSYTLRVHMKTHQSLDTWETYTPIEYQC